MRGARSVRTALNRTVLAVTGLGLLLVGGWLAFSGSALADRLPAGWPVPGADATFLDRDDLTAVRAESWWTPVVLAASVTAAVLCAVWCLRQARSGARARLPLPVAGSSLRGRALEDAVNGHAAAIDGVDHCRTRVTARRRRVRVTLRVRLDPATAPGAVLPRLTALASRTEGALAPYTVDTRVRFTTRSHRAPHVR
ncbi:hypothetical protein ACIPPJ_30750 [Streptomyces sp. NPDC086091]|uniref:hypothetical protein n=1 Tax=Streptomyces sp. NPDC086091 TaxID=3365751 RepID=UPI00382FE951